jgi:Tfp pilus assembly PilM family ATPase
MALQTAIDYSGRRVRLLKFDGSGKKIRVLGVYDVSLDVTADDEMDPDDVRALAIAAAVKESGCARDPCAMAFDAGNAMFREFDLPFTNDDQIKKVMRFEAESHFGGDIDEFVIQHIVLRKSRDKSHLLVAGIKKDDLLDRLDILDESGLDPMSVEIDGFALYNALVATGIAGEHERMAVVNAQEGSATLMFLVDGELFALRSIRIGTHGILHGDAESGRDGGLEQDVETARTHDYLTRLTREVRRTLGTIPDLGSLDALYVAGGGSRLPGFDEAVGGALGAIAQPLDLLSEVNHKLSEADVEEFGHEIGVALGTAFKLNGVDVTRADFRREEVAYTRKFDQVKLPLIVMSFALFLVVAFMGLDAYKRRQHMEGEYTNILKLATAQLSELVLDDSEVEETLAAAEFGPDRIRAAMIMARDLKEGIEQQLGRGQRIPEQRSGLAVWIELFATIRESEDPIGRIALDRIDIEVSSRNPYITLSGEVEDQTHFQELLDVLGERPMFSTVRPGGTRQTSSGLRFTDLELALDLSTLDGPD